MRLDHAAAGRATGEDRFLNAGDRGFDDREGLGLLAGREPKSAHQNCFSHAAS
jgi:hypothetical protein